MKSQAYNRNTPHVRTANESHFNSAHMSATRTCVERIQCHTHTHTHNTHSKNTILRNDTTIPSHNHGSSTSFKTPISYYTKCTHSTNRCKHHLPPVIAQACRCMSAKHTYTHIMQAHNTSSRLVSNPIATSRQTHYALHALTCDHARKYHIIARTHSCAENT